MGTTNFDAPTESGPYPEILVQAQWPWWIVNRTTGGKIVLERHLIAKGLMKFIANFL